LADRDMFFRGRTEVEIDIDGERHVFTLRPTFFRKCPEIWDQDGKPPVIRNWLARYRSLTWDDTPPQAELLPEGNGFVLRPL
jgi:hypothetical protein